jgi:hypothetical protein
MVTRLYRYWLNVPDYHAKCIFEFEAATMAEADEAFELGVYYPPLGPRISVEICSLTMDQSVL